MRLGGLSYFAGVLVAALAVSVARAQDSEADDTLMDIGMLPCAGACAVVTKPIRLSKSRPRFPEYIGRDSSGQSAEALVTLRYTVEENGAVSQITTVQQIGPDGFVESAKHWAKSLTFQPATSEGKPIAASQRIAIMFVNGNPRVKLGARRAIITAYSNVLDLYRAGKLDEAATALDQAQSLQQLNFYERGMIAHARATIAIKQQNYLEARQLVSISAYYQKNLLPPSVVRGLWHIRIAADLQLGDVADAVRSLEELRKVPGFDPADPAIALVADYRKSADAAEAFKAEGKIPPTGQGDVFVFELYRRDFAIQNISGALQKFTVDCNQRVSESPISDKAEWHLPRNWSNCHLYIQGLPGTTFQIVQLSGAPPLAR